MPERALDLLDCSALACERVLAGAPLADDGDQREEPTV